MSTRVFKSAADAVLKAIGAARAVIALAIVAAIVLCVPDQTFEIYRVLVDPLQSSHLPPSVLALTVATFTIWWTSKVAIKIARPASTSPAYRFAAGSLPLLIAAVIPIATFTGMIRAVVPSTASRRELEAPLSRYGHFCRPSSWTTIQ